MSSCSMAGRSENESMEPIFYLKGLIIGFAMAVPVGPIGIMCIRGMHPKTTGRGALARPGHRPRD
jgi:hypothetical protein